jgi:hypothetical protein
MQVACDIGETELENDDGRLIPSICATCTRCGHETESYGTGDASVARCLVLMREECPRAKVITT